MRLTKGKGRGLPIHLYVAVQHVTGVHVAYTCTHGCSCGIHVYTISIFIPLLSFQCVRVRAKRGVSSYFCYLRVSSKHCSQPFPPPTLFKPAASAWPSLQPAISSAAAANRLAIAADLSRSISVPLRAPAFRCFFTSCCGSGLHSTQGSDLKNPRRWRPPSLSELAHCVLCMLLTLKANIVPRWLCVLVCGALD